MDPDSGTSSLAARLTELLFTLGEGAALPVSQAASILGVPSTELRQEARHHHTTGGGYLDVDAGIDTVYLRMPGDRRLSVPASPWGSAPLTDEGEGEDVFRKTVPRPLRKKGSGPPIRGASPFIGPSGHEEAHQRYYTIQGRQRGSGYRSETWQQQQTANMTQRRRGPVRKPGQRGARLEPAERTEGRVGYICVADEFNLDELEKHYALLGYFTKIDLGVLHIRLAEDQWPSSRAHPQLSPGGEKDGSIASYGATDATAAEGIVQPAAPEDSTMTINSEASPTLLNLRRNPFDLFVFDYGAAVWWGADHRYFKVVENDFLLPGSALTRHMVNRYSTQLIAENYPVWCSYALVRSESLDADDDFKQSLTFDQFLIPYGRDGDTTLCGISMLCASHALAQSAKIDYLELKVEELAESCSPLPRELRERGRVSISERRLLQLRGEVLSYRLMLKSGSDLLDEPDFFWENGHLKPIFEATKEGFAISARVEALDNKLDATNEILSMLAEEFAQRHGARLEWIVIWLVFVEVIIGVLELLVDIRPWVRSLPLAR